MNNSNADIKLACLLLLFFKAILIVLGIVVYFSIFTIAIAVNTIRAIELREERSHYQQTKDLMLAT